MKVPIYFGNTYAPKMVECKLIGVYPKKLTTMYVYQSIKHPSVRTAITEVNK